MAKRKLNSGSSSGSLTPCSWREHSMATKAAPWLKPRMPSNGPWAFTASLTTVTLSSSPRLSSHCCWALKLRAWTSENHQPLGSSSPAGPEPFPFSGASEKTEEQNCYSNVTENVSLHSDKKYICIKTFFFEINFYKYFCWKSTNAWVHSCFNLMCKV